MANDYGDTSSADILAGINKDLAAAKAGKTSNSKFVPNFILPANDDLEFSDDLELNGGLIEFEDSIEFSDDAVVTGFTAGLFQITDDAGGGVGVTQPGKIDFADIG